jgi:hypothetical protein
MGNGKRLTFLFLLVLIVAFPACGSVSAPSTSEESATETAPPEAPANEVLASSLLTEAEVAGLLGEPIQEVKESGSGAVSNCTWLTNSFRSIGVLVRAGGSSEESRTIFEQAFNSSKSISGVEPEQVEGVGDLAYWAGGSLNQMNVLKGRTWIIVSTMAVDAKKSQSVARQAALLVVDRVQ